MRRSIRREHDWLLAILSSLPSASVQTLARNIVRSSGSAELVQLEHLVGALEVLLLVLVEHAVEGHGARAGDAIDGLVLEGALLLGVLLAVVVLLQDGLSNVVRPLSLSVLVGVVLLALALLLLAAAALPVLGGILARTGPGGTDSRDYVFRSGVGGSAADSRALRPRRRRVLVRCGGRTAAAGCIKMFSTGSQQRQKSSNPLTTCLHRGPCGTDAAIDGIGIGRRPTERTSRHHRPRPHVQQGRWPVTAVNAAATRRAAAIAPLQATAATSRQASYDQQARVSIDGHGRRPRGITGRRGATRTGMARTTGITGTATDGDVRVHDFLDDKLQTAGDLDALDALLANITTQHGLLKQQLDDAQRDLHDATARQRDHHAQLSPRRRPSAAPSRTWTAACWS